MGVITKNQANNCCRSAELSRKSNLDPRAVAEMLNTSIHELSGMGRSELNENVSQLAAVEIEQLDLALN